MSLPGKGWPASDEALRSGRRFVLEQTEGRTVIAPDADVDGLSAALLVARTLERLGRTQVEVELLGKGEHPHLAAFLARVRARRPSALVVLDMGSRAGPLLAAVPTLVVDHHRPEGFPPGATPVSAYGHEPVAPTSLLAWELLRAVASIDDLAWLAALGIWADLGAKAPFRPLATWLSRYGRRNVSEAVALLNAPRRSSGHDVAAAYAVLAAARGPAEIARGEVPGVERLRAAREEVSEEVRRCAKTRPLFAGSFALLPMRSGAKVHPLVAQRWAGRLRGHIVVAANFGYLPGRVNFALRSAGEEDLIEALRGLGAFEGEFAHGHARATGGSLPYPEFARLLTAMGFSRDAELPVR